MTVSKQLRKVGFVQTDAVEGKVQFKRMKKDHHWDMLCCELEKRSIPISPTFNYMQMKLLQESEGGASGFKPLHLTTKEWIEAQKQTQARDKLQIIVTKNAKRQSFL